MWGLEALQLPPAAVRVYGAVCALPEGALPLAAGTDERICPPTPAADPVCQNTAAGPRYVTNASPTIYPTACASAGACFPSVRRCERFQYTGIKVFNSCGDGQCWRQLITSAGSPGWILESGVNSIPSAACATGESPKGQLVCVCLWRAWAGRQGALACPTH